MNYKQILTIWSITVISVLTFAHRGMCAEVSGGVNLTSNFVYRGISYSDNKQAIQGFLQTKGANGIYVGSAITSWHDQINDSKVVLVPYVGYEYKRDNYLIDLHIKYRNYFGEPSYDWIEGVLTGTYRLSENLSTSLELATSPEYMRNDGIMYNTTYSIDYHYRMVLAGMHYGWKDIKGNDFTDGHTDKYWGLSLGIGLHENALLEYSYSNTNMSDAYPFNMADEHHVVSLKFGF